MIAQSLHPMATLKHSLVLALVLLFSSQLFATHIVGGGIKWKEDDRDLVIRFLDDLLLRQIFRASFCY